MRKADYRLDAIMMATQSAGMNLGVRGILGALSAKRLPRRQGVKVETFALAPEPPRSKRQRRRDRGRGK